MALKNWRPLLAGSPHKIIIYSDHLNLQYWSVMIRTLRVMGLVPPQYVITSYRFRLFPLFPLYHYYPILVLSMITHRLTCFNCVWLCPALWYQLCDRLSI